MTKETEETKREEPAEITRLRSLYPTNKTIYQTSDGLTFLANEKKEAEAHQKSIGKGELTTY